MLPDICADVEKSALVLDGNERALGAVVHRDPERLDQRPERFNVALDAHIPENEKRRADRRLPDRRVASDKERHAEFSLEISRSMTSTCRSEVSRSRAMPRSDFFAAH